MECRGLYYTIVPCYIGPTQTLESSFQDSDLKPKDVVTFHIVLKNHHHRPINSADQEDDNIASSSSTTQSTYYGFWETKRSITTFSHPFNHPDYLPIEYFICGIDHNNVNGFSELPCEFWIIVRDKVISFINRQLLFEMEVMTGFEMLVDVNAAEGYDPAYQWWTRWYSAYSWWYWYGASADASLSLDHEVSADQEDGSDEITDGDGVDDDELDMDRIVAGIEALLSS